MASVKNSSFFFLSFLSSLIIIDWGRLAPCQVNRESPPWESGPGAHPRGRNTFWCWAGEGTHRLCLFTMLSVLRAEPQKDGAAARPTRSRRKYCGHLRKRESRGVKLFFLSPLPLDKSFPAAAFAYVRGKCALLATIGRDDVSVTSSRPSVLLFQRRNCAGVSAL